MLFSIIVPCYNVEAYVEKCIESVMAQTFSDFELILVDDGSTDKTLAILNSFRMIDSRIKIVSKKNGGLTSARKAGLEVAEGEYIVPIDGDDWISPNYLVNFYTAISKYHPDVLSCGYIRASDERLTEYPPSTINMRHGYFSKEELIQHLYPELLYSIPFLCSKVCKKQLYYKYQMTLDNRIIMGEDGAITYPMLIEANSFYVLNDCLYYYRFNSGSITGNKRKYIPWDNVLLKTERFVSLLPLDKYNLDVQVASLTIHSVTNVILSHFRNEKYSTVVNETKHIMEKKGIKKYIVGAIKCPDIRVRIAAIALRYRLYWLLKLWSLH